MRYGYARVSSKAQDYQAQVEALKAAGCERIFSEKQSGKSRDGRPEFDRLMKALLPGDTVVVTKLDRLARSSRDLHRRIGKPLGRLYIPWRGMVRHDHRRRQVDADDHGRHRRVRAQPDSQPPRMRESSGPGDRARGLGDPALWMMARRRSSPNDTARAPPFRNWPRSTGSASAPFGGHFNPPRLKWKRRKGK